MFNNILKFLSWPLIVRFVHGIFIHGVSGHSLVRCLSAVFVIILYAGVEGVFAVDEKPKFRSGALYSRDGLIEPWEIFFLPPLVGGVEANEFIKDKRSELGSGSEIFGKFYIFFDPIDGCHARPYYVILFPV